MLLKLQSVHHVSLRALAAVSVCCGRFRARPQVCLLQDHEFETEPVACLLRVSRYLAGNRIDGSEQVGIRAEAVAEFRVAGDLLIR